MRSLIALAALLAATLAVPSGADARSLLPSDPYDGRIIAAHNCNNSAKAVGFGTMILAECRAVYDETVRFEQSRPQMTAAQKNAIAIAKGLSMMTLAAGYLDADGVMSARACAAIGGIDRSLAGYDTRVHNGLQKLHDLLVRTRDVAVPKCRKGGHWAN